MGTVFTPGMYEDVNMGVGRSQVGGSAPSLVNVNSTGIYLRAFSIGDSVSDSFEIPHAGKVSVAMTPHIHFLPDAAPSGTQYVNWQIEYVLLANNGIFQTPTTITTGDIQVNASAFQIQVSNFSSTITNLSDVGGQFCFTLERIATTGSSFSGDIIPTT